MAPPEVAARRQQQGPDKLGDLLVKSGKITQSQLQEALAFQKDQGGRIGTNLIKLGHLTDRQLVEALSEQFKVPSVDLTSMEVDESVVKIIPADIAR